MTLERGMGEVKIDLQYNVAMIVVGDNRHA
jgi:hypothetical protein